MTAMADDTVSNVDNHHDEEEWDSQRENFTQFYIMENRTLKDATQLMATTYGFHATARQWERRINVWGLSKYTSRDERLKQIKAQGRSIHEVAELGRRPRNFGESLLHPDAAVDDRNIRRFARRELGRSNSHRERSRSRSNSSGKRPRSTTPHLRRKSAPDVVHETLLGMSSQPDHSGGVQGLPQDNMLSMSGMPAEQNSSQMQSDFLQDRSPTTGGPNDDMLLSMRDEDLMTGEMPTYETSQFGFSSVTNSFNRPHNFPSDVTMDTGSPFPALDEEFGGQGGFDPSQGGMPLGDASFNQTSNHQWPSQSPFPPPSIDTTASGYSGSITGSTSFHQTPTNDAMPMKEFGNVSPLNDRAFSVPEIVFHDSTEAGFMPSQTTQSLYRVSSEDQDVYDDFFAALGDFTQTVHDAAMSVCIPGSLQANNLGDMINYERSVFREKMTVTLNNFLNSQRRANQSIYEYNQRLKQRNRDLEQEKAKFHAHRSSLPTSMNPANMNYHFPHSNQSQSGFGPS